MTLLCYEEGVDSESDAVTISAPNERVGAERYAAQRDQRTIEYPRERVVCVLRNDTLGARAGWLRFVVHLESVPVYHATRL